MLFDHLKDTVTIIRDGQPRELSNVFLSGKRLQCKFDADIREGDRIRHRDHPEEYVVSDVKRNRPPGSLGRGMEHTEATLVSVAKWERLNRPDPVPPPASVTQHFGNIGQVGAIAGRDAQGSVTTMISVEQFLTALEKEIEEDPTIPEDEKKTLRARIKEFVTNPRMVGRAVRWLWEAGKAAVTGG